jgi:hypothetical protein
MEFHGLVLSDRFQVFAFPDLFVSREQCHALGSRGRTYKPVGRIARIIFGELSGERSDRRRQGMHGDPGGIQQRLNPRRFRARARILAKTDVRSPIT